MFFKSTALFIVAMALMALAATEREIKSIAILDLEGSGMDAGEIKTLSEALRNSIIDQGAFTVLERSKMDVILKEQGFQQSGACTNEACAVEMGQLLGVDAMVIGSVGKVGKTYSVTVRMLDLQTGKIVHSASQYYKGEIDGLLTETIEGISVKMCAYARKGVGAPGDAVEVSKEGAADEGAAETEGVKGKKSNTWMYITIGAVVLVGGVSAIFLLTRDEDKGPAAEEPQERPSYPLPPSKQPLLKGGN